MITARYIQGPGERLRYVIDLTLWLASGETISSVTATFDPLFVEIEAIAVLADTQKAFEFFISAAYPHTGTHTVVFETTTTDAQVREDTVSVVFSQRVTV